MTKTKRIYLFAVALFFVSVFFAGAGSARADECSDCTSYAAGEGYYDTWCVDQGFCAGTGGGNDITTNNAFDSCNGVGDVWNSTTSTCETYSCDPGWTLKNGQCEEDNYNPNSSDFSAWCDTHPGDADCQSAYNYAENASTETACGDANGVWMDSTCYNSKDEYCAQSIGAGYTWSTVRQKCTGDNSASCADNSDCAFGIDCNNGICGTLAPATLTAAEKAEADKIEAKRRAEAEASVAAQKGAYQKVQTTSAAVQSACSVPASAECTAAKKAYEDAQIAMKAADVQAKAAVEAYNGAAVAGGANASVGGGYMLCANGILGRICEGGGGTPYVAGISTGGFSGGIGFGSYGSGTSGVTPPKCGNGFQDISGVCFPMTTGLSNAPIGTILNNLFSWLMGLFTTFAMIAFVVSGLQYFMASGDESMAEKAKENATNAIIGVIVGLSGFIILKAIAAALSGQSYFF